MEQKEYTYLGSVTGNFNPRLFPTDVALQLKAGAQVMFVKNDPQRRFVNGTIGKITSLNHDQIFVQIEKPDGSKQKIEVEKLEWEILRHSLDDQASEGAISTETIGSFKQYPLRLAWAITIHKSQGKTFDKVIINMGKGAFEHGQTYVALSRCRTLDGIVLKQALRPNDIMTDERIVEYYEGNF
ncbi:MAG: hypothetical protein AAF990_15215 [Bacteroidota bacterium]